MRSSAIGALVAVGLLLAPSVASAGDLKSTAKSTVAKSRKAVVTVRVVLKLSAEGGEIEQKFEITGTVVDPSGLTVLSASAIDPGKMVNCLMACAQTGGGGGPEGMPGAPAKFDSEVSEVTIILEDGTEVEADVVLKDSDLDLAFLRPRQAQKLEAVELKAKPALELLDEVFVVSRLGRIANRAPAASLSTVKAVVQTPRVYAVCNDDLSEESVGCMVFGSDGAPVGVVARKMREPSDGGTSLSPMGLLLGSMPRVAILVVRPINEVIELAALAKVAKAPEPKAKADEPKDAEAPKAKDEKAEPSKDEKAEPKPASPKGR